MKALVIGATGSRGKLLVDKLLEDMAYRTVVIFVSKTLGKEHPKLIEHIVNLSHLDAYREYIVGDVVFLAFWETLHRVGLNESQWKDDFVIPWGFAELARENGTDSFVLVSSLHASTKSRIFYFKMKGKLEEQIAGLNFEQYIIFKPGPLSREASDPIEEKIIIRVLKLFNSMGLLRKFMPLPTEVLAEKLAKAPRVLPKGISVIQREDIFIF